MSERKSSTTIFDPGPFELAEGPIFDTRTNALIWVDIKGRAIFYRELSGSETNRIAVDEDVGCVALTADRDVVIAALRSGWYELNLRDGGLRLLAASDHPTPTHRFNDGAVDVLGCLWTGSLEDTESDPVGVLYRLDPNGRFQSVDSGFIASNGIDWSPDSKWMYFVDSRQRTIYRYPFDADSGEIGSREIFVDTGALQGLPDGLAVDCEGTVWCAFWDGAALHGFDPAGNLIETIELPVIRPTSVAFGGPDLRVMYVTSASFGLSPALRRAWPASGGVLELNTSCPGRPANLFGVSSHLL